MPVTISDRNLDGTADVYTASDYYPFGMQMPERSYSYGGKYRFSFNGKETDPSTGLQDYGFRIYNPAIGKFLSVDPLTKDYPWYTPYQFAGNKPVQCIDLDGLEEIPNELTQRAKNAIKGLFNRVASNLVRAVISKAEDEYQEQKKSEPEVHAYGLTIEFMTGVGPATQTFSDAEAPAIVARLKDAYQTNRAREYWYRKNLNQYETGNLYLQQAEGTEQGEGIVSLEAEANVTGFAAGFSPFAALWRSSAQGDIIEQFIGSYSINMTTDGEYLYFEVLDSKSTYSLFFHAVPPLEDRDDNLSTIEPFTNTYLRYTWKEKINLELFEQTKTNAEEDGGELNDVTGEGFTLNNETDE